MFELALDDAQGLLKEAERLKLRHLVSDGCGGIGDIRAVDERFGSDGISRSDMRLDHGTKDQFLSRAELAADYQTVFHLASHPFLWFLALFRVKC